MDSGTALAILNTLYGKVLGGTGGGALKSAEEIAEEYLRDNNSDKEAAIDSLINWHAAKAAAGGFVTNLGGLMTLPVAIPANLASSFYIQLRMIAAVAYIRGYNLNEDKVRTFCYLCLAGTGASDVLKKSGIKVAQRITANMIMKHVSGALLIKINKAAGMRLITKAGTAGIINLTKLVPLVGGVIGGGVDLYTAKTVGIYCKQFFVKAENEEEAEEFSCSQDIDAVIALPYAPVNNPQQ